jgi:Bacterial Ig-like domain (group 3)/FG-GAP-like repeat
LENPLKRRLQVAAIGFCFGASFVSASAQAPTTTNLAVTFNGSPVTAVNPGSAITLTATVTSGSTPVTPGQVNFCDASVSWCTDIHLLGMAQLTASGTATLTFVPGIGVHRIQAVFVGTNADAASSSTVSTLTVVGTKLPWSFSSYEHYNFVLVPTDPAPQAEVIADFNGDGKPDMAVAIGNAGAPASSVDVFLGNGDGTFHAAPSVPSTNATAGSIIAGDFNGDGKQDLAVVLPDVNQIQILLGNGDGTFTLGQNISDSSRPFEVVTGDFNRDGIADLAVVNFGGNNIIILLGKGDGTFTQAAQSPTFAASPVSAAVGDFNGDGKDDLAVALDGVVSSDPGSVTILLGNGDGTFTPTTQAQTLATSPSPTSITAADFTGNGILDLAVASAVNSASTDATINLFAGNGNGTFMPASGLISYAGYNSIAFGDVENNGYVDLFAAGVTNAAVDIFYGQENGISNDESSTGVGSGPIFVAVDDLNGDGFADFAAVLNSLNSVFVFTSGIYGNSTQVPTTTTLTAVPTSLTAGQTLTLTATVTASSGAPPAGTVYFLNGVFTLGQANLNSSGVATLSLSPAAGAYSVTASYAGSSTDAPSVSEPPIAVNVGNLISTSTSLLASATTLPVGQTVTLSATVTAAGGSIPGGSVTFFNGAAPLGTGTLSTKGVATIQTSLLPPGANSITAAYPGEANFAASTSQAVMVTVNAYGATTTALAITSGGYPVSTIISGNAVQLTATVTSPGGAVTPGQVNFCDATVSYCTDIHLLGTAQLSVSGTAAVTLIPAVGNHSYKAVFLGANLNGASSSSSSPLTVTPPALYPTTTALAASGSTPPYTLTATVSGGLPIAPTGTVTYIDTTNDNYVLGTATLAPGVPTTGLTFFQASSPPTTLGFIDMAIADLTGNGENDLVLAGPNPYGFVVTQPENTTNILLGNGDGTYTITPPTEQFYDVDDMAVADFNEDGIPDLALVQYQGPLTAMLGNGSGKFTPQTPIPITYDSYVIGGYAVATADFNGDGHADLAVLPFLTNSGNQINILLGNGDGTFAQGPYVTLTGTDEKPASTAAIAVGDFNGDGKPDLLVVDNDYNTITIFLGNGDGTFQALAPITGVAPTGFMVPFLTSVVVADFNGDGKIDIAVETNGFYQNGTYTPEPGPIVIYLGNGDGTFTRQATSPMIDVGFALVAGDFNGDGIVDLASTNSLNPAGSGETNGGVTVLLGKGDGAFDAPIYVPTGGSPQTLGAADMNHDGLWDFVNSVVETENGVQANYVATWLAQQQGTIDATAVINNVQLVGTETHYVEAKYSGSTFYAGSTSQPIPLVGQQVPTTLSLTTSLTAITEGQSILLTATLTPNQAQNQTATGDVAFTVHVSMTGLNMLLGTAPVANGVATLNTTALPAGVDTVTAVYFGDMNFAESSSNAVTIAVTAATKTALTAAPIALILGQTLTLTATVTATGGTPTGTVTFFNGTAQLGSMALNTNGVATLETNALPVGVFTLTASYAATVGFAASTSPPVSVSVASPTTTTLNAVPTTLTVGQTLTLTATVTASSGGTPAGTVSFLNGAATLGTATLNAKGVATLNLTPAVGNYSVTASYAGTLTDAPSTSSPPITVTVNNAATYSALVASPTNLFVGQTLTLTATVTAASGATPAGTVTYLNNGATLGTASLNANGVAALTLTPAIGNYSITASYGGSSTDAPSVSSPPIAVKVTIIPTTILLTATPLSLTVTQTLTLTVVVNASGPAPTGTVTFNNTNPLTGTVQPLGTALLNSSGAATLTLMPAAGSYVISATYGGSATDSPSTSSQIDVIVNPATTITLLTASPNPANLGQLVTLSATVTSAIGTPTGTINFYDGATLLGSEPVASGTATFSTSGLSIGNHSLTAVYSGATNFLTSNSAAVDEVITAPSFSISISPPKQSVYTGESAIYTVTFTQAAGLNLEAALSCSQLPENTTCTFSQGVMSESGTSTLSVHTTAPKADSSASVVRAGAGAALACLFLCLVPRRRHKAPLLFLIVTALAVSATALSGCSGPQMLTGGTPVGPQTVTVSATMTDQSQQFTQNATLTLTVKSLF